jgi:hypothetical protein
MAGTLRCVDAYPADSVDDLREVPHEDDQEPVLPDQTRDDTDLGWGERAGGNDDRLLEERPPHW